MDNSIIKIPADLCTGCGSCFNKCPKGAITMAADKDGFPVPVIDEARCIDCGLCLKACPVNEPSSDNSSEPECYAVMGSDELRMKSSSGGVFTMLAEWMLDHGGVVCGAAYADDWHSVNHIIVSDREGLAKLRGSKYVQSSTGTVYKEIKEYLANDVPVLFTGTPCQAAALSRYIGKSCEKLYIVDLVCHGVPSPALYSDFIREQEEKYQSRAVRVSFRDKDIVGWNVSMAIDFENGEKYRKTREDDTYLKAFLRIASMRKSCGQCPFATLPRYGDLTIADFWGVRFFNPKFDDKKGTSLVTVNNDKGRRLLAAFEGNTKLFSEASLEIAGKYNANLIRSSKLHPHRNYIYDLFSHYKRGFEKSVNDGMNRRFDIGYVGWWYGTNYGSTLTNFAMNRVLRNMGKTVLMLEYPIMTDTVPASMPAGRGRNLGAHFYETSALTKLADYSRFNNHCDTFVLGSDQLWNWYSNRSTGSYHYFLDFVDKNHKKIAYATSFGHDYVHYPEEMRLKIGYLLQRFDALSVRENSAVEVCRRDFNVDAVQVIDPVFLCDMDSYDQAIALSSIKLEHESYVLAYLLNPTHDKLEAVRHTAAQRGLPYKIILDGQSRSAELMENAENDPNIVGPLEVADWLNYFRHADNVVTDSFHGFCYSVIFQRNMVIFPNEKRGMARFNTIADLTGLHGRLCYSLDEFMEKKLWEVPVDFEAVSVMMKPHIEFGFKWLTEALEQHKRVPSIKELQLKQALDFKTKQAALEKQFAEAQANDRSASEKRFAKISESISPAQSENSERLKALEEANIRQAEQIEELRALLADAEQRLNNTINNQGWIIKVLRKLGGK